MKKLLTPIVCALAVVLGVSCSKSTLYVADVDAKSLVPDQFKTLDNIPVAAGGYIVRLPDGATDSDGGLISGLPTLGFLQRFEVGAGVKVDAKTANTTPVTATLEVFVGPSAEANLYQPKYSVASTGLVSVAPGESKLVEVNASLSASSASVAQQQAFAEVKKGTFRWGVQVAVSSGANAQFKYTLDKAKFVVAGYPFQAVLPAPQ